MTNVAPKIISDILPSLALWRTRRGGQMDSDSFEAPKDRPTSATSPFHSYHEEEEETGGRSNISAADWRARAEGQPSFLIGPRGWKIAFRSRIESSSLRDFWSGALLPSPLPTDISFRLSIDCDDDARLGTFYPRPPSFKYARVLYQVSPSEKTEKCACQISTLHNTST